MQFLFQEEFLPEGSGGQEDIAVSFERFCAFYPAQKLALPYALRLLQGIALQLAQIDDLIRQSASNWRVERIAFVDRNILRIAVYEMLYSDDAPDQVVINEAVEIAKRYGTGESPSFINGVLDAVRSMIRDGGGSGGPEASMVPSPKN